MRIAKLNILLLGLAFMLGCAAKQPPLPVSFPYANPYEVEKGTILHAPTGRQFSETELYDYLGEHRVIYVGESHDSVDDHEVQLKVLRAMHERFPGQIALGLEMLRLPAQAAADKFIAGEMDEKKFFGVWARNWGNSYIYYEKILDFCRENKIPLLAMNADRVTMAQLRGGLDKVDEVTRDVLPEMNMDDPYYRTFLASMFGGHEMAPDMMERFYTIQTLWDETMAATGAAYLAKQGHEDKKLVVIAGGNHVRFGIGIPRRLFRRLPEPFVIVSPVAVFTPEELEERKSKMMDVKPVALPLPQAEFTWTVGYEDLEDQRVMLGVGIGNAEKGVEVKSVMPESPAAKAGVEKDDIIIYLGGDIISEVPDLTYKVSQYQSGEEAALIVIRGEDSIILDIVMDTVDHGVKPADELHGKKKK